MKVRIKKKGKLICINEITEDISKDLLNVTNIFNFKEIIFEVDKLKEPFISDFLQKLFKKEEIEDVEIEKFVFAEHILNITKNVETINKIIFKEEQTLPNELFNILKQHLSLKEIECYQINNSLFEECNQIEINIRTKKRVFLKSNFIIINNLNTHSDMYYKKNIIMNSNYTESDLSDFLLFLENNKNLNQIDFYSYSEDILSKVILLLSSYKKKNIKINVYQQVNDNQKINEIVDELIKTFKKEIKENHFHIQIKYTKKYKKKNLLKQVNLNMFRLICFILILMTSIILITYKYHLDKSKSETNIIEESILEIDEPKIETIDNDTISNNEEDKSEEIKENEYNKKYNNDLSELLKINNETVGWLTVNKTNINYPVVQHSNNDYYLNHSFSKKNNINGWIFLDYRNKVDNWNQNSIIYGHDSTNNILFGDLKKILKKSWYTNKSNQLISFITKEKKYQFQIISIYTIKNTNDYLASKFSETEFEEYLNRIVDRSIYDFKIETSIKDKILTLSTCYKDSNHRLVVHAKLIN